jgi:DNA-directed RNA polymerase specialized sigma subunit
MDGIPSLGDNLEDEYRGAFTDWQNNQTPEGNAAFLRQIDPIIQRGVSMYGDNSPLTTSRAKLLALESARKYDQKRSRLQSHILNNMQSLRRIRRQQEEVIRVPERVMLERNHLQQAAQQYRDELGYEPSDAELADHLKVSMARLQHLRSYQPGMLTGKLEETDQSQPASRLPTQQRFNQWAEVVYHDLSPMDQKIMELALGMHGIKPLSNQEIAKRLNRSPGAITQRKLKIQELLDREGELSPFEVQS